MVRKSVQRALATWKQPPVSKHELFGGDNYDSEEDIGPVPLGGGIRDESDTNNMPDLSFVYKLTPRRRSVKQEAELDTTPPRTTWFRRSSLKSSSIGNKQLDSLRAAFLAGRKLPSSSSSNHSRNPLVDDDESSVGDFEIDASTRSIVSLEDAVLEGSGLEIAQFKAPKLCQITKGPHDEKDCVCCQLRSRQNKLLPELGAVTDDDDDEVGLEAGMPRPTRGVRRVKTGDHSGAKVSRATAARKKRRHTVTSSMLGAASPVPLATAWARSKPDDCVMPPRSAAIVPSHVYTDNLEELEALEETYGCLSMHDVSPMSSLSSIEGPGAVKPRRSSADNKDTNANTRSVRTSAVEGSSRSKRRSSTTADKITESAKSAKSSAKEGSSRPKKRTSNTTDELSSSRHSGAAKELSNSRHGASKEPSTRSSSRTTKNDAAKEPSSRASRTSSKKDPSLGQSKRESSRRTRSTSDKEPSARTSAKEPSTRTSRTSINREPSTRASRTSIKEPITRSKRTSSTAIDKEPSARASRSSGDRRMSQSMKEPSVRTRTAKEPSKRSSRTSSTKGKEPSTRSSRTTKDRSSMMSTSLRELSTRKEDEIPASDASTRSSRTARDSIPEEGRDQAMRSQSVRESRTRPSLSCLLDTYNTSPPQDRSLRCLSTVGLFPDEQDNRAGSSRSKSRSSSKRRKKRTKSASARKSTRSSLSVTNHTATTSATSGDDESQVKPSNTVYEQPKPSLAVIVTTNTSIAPTDEFGFLILTPSKKDTTSVFAPADAFAVPSLESFPDDGKHSLKFEKLEANHSFRLSETRL